MPRAEVVTIGTGEPDGHATDRHPSVTSSGPSNQLASECDWRWESHSIGRSWICPGALPPILRRGAIQRRISRGVIDLGQWGLAADGTERRGSLPGSKAGMDFGDKNKAVASGTIPEHSNGRALESIILEHFQWTAES